MRFNKETEFEKIICLVKHIKVRTGKRNPFDYDCVKKTTRELIKKQRLEAKANKNNNYNF